MTAARDGGREPTDPDVDLTVPEQRQELAHGGLPVLTAVAAGGGLGAAARYGAGLLWPTGPEGFPWTILAVNAAGCAVIGVFMVVITELWQSHRLARPFFGVGVLGGFTTFSAYAGDAHRLLEDGRTGTGLAYLAATPLLAVTAVWCAATVTRRLLAPESGVNWLLVIIGGMAGAPLRYLTDRAVQAWHGTGFPWGTVAVNVAGCLILGVLTGAVIEGAGSDSAQLLIGTGLCGALTTYSTFSYETMQLAETGAALSAAVNVVLSVTAGLTAVFAGTAFAQALWS